MGQERTLVAIAFRSEVEVKGPLAVTAQLQVSSAGRVQDRSVAAS